MINNRSLIRWSFIYLPLMIIPFRVGVVATYVHHQRISAASGRPLVCLCHSDRGFVSELVEC